MKCWLKKPVWVTPGTKWYHANGTTSMNSPFPNEWSHSFLSYRPVVSFFVRRRQFLLVRIDHEHGQQLSGFGLARVLTNAVPVTRHLGEALSGAISNGRPIIDRTSDRSFENGCVDESRLGMRVGRRRPSGTIFDQYTLDAFARHIWQSVLVDERDLCIFVSGYP